jgi:hypothetical protein
MKRLLAVLVAAALVCAPSAGAWTWPVEGPVVRPFVFGSDPYAAGQHRGIDIGAQLGTPVVAAAAGKVSFVGSVPAAGRAVTVQTPGGLSVTYLELGATHVASGAEVSEGDPIGTIGAAAHLHFGVRVTAEPQGYLDPLAFLPARTEAPAAADAAEAAAPVVALPDPVPEPASADPAEAEPDPVEPVGAAPVAEPGPVEAEPPDTGRVADPVADPEPAPEPPVVSRPEPELETASVQEPAAEPVSATTPADAVVEVTAPAPVPEPEPVPVSVVQIDPVLEPAPAELVVAEPDPIGIGAADDVEPELMPAAEAGAVTGAATSAVGATALEAVPELETISAVEPGPVLEPAHGAPITAEFDPPVEAGSLVEAESVLTAAESDVVPVPATPAADATAAAAVSQPEASAVAQVDPVPEPPLAGADVVASDGDDVEAPVEAAPEPALPAIAIAGTERSEATGVVATLGTEADTTGMEGETAREPGPTQVGATGASEPLEAPQLAVPIVQVTPVVGLSSAPEAVVAPVQATERPLTPSSGAEKEPPASRPLHARLTSGVAGGGAVGRPTSLDVPASAPAADEVRDRRRPDDVSPAQPVTDGSDAPARIVQNPEADESNVGLGAEMLLAVLAVMLRGGAAATRRRSRPEAPTPAPAASGRCPVGRERRPRLLHGCARGSGQPWLLPSGRRPRVPVPLRPLPRPRRTERSGVRS